MKTPRLLILLLIVFFLTFPVSLFSQQTSSWSVYFSPKGGATEAIVKELGQAKTLVLVQAYSFTSSPIAKALLDAHKRRVKVQVILDKSQRAQKYSSLTFFDNQGIRVRIDASHAIVHNKIVLIGSEIVLTGSFNFSKAAEENNAENLLVIRDRRLAELYTKNFREHEGHSEVYGGRGRNEITAKYVCQHRYHSWSRVLSCGWAAAHKGFV